MSKHFRPLMIFFALMIVTLACALPVSLTQPAPLDPNQVGTVVAMTLTALPHGGESPSASLLPHALYYLSKDSGGLTQIFRIEKDGTARQVTTEPSDVGNYDVSPVDGGIAYVANNQIVYVNADGAGRRVLVDGGTPDPNNPFLDTINSPVFSPDGQTLAYGYKGLQLYSFATGGSEMLIENKINDAGNGFLTPRELYSPWRYSADASKLLITLGYYESASTAVYVPSTRALVRLEGGEGAPICCGDLQWSADGASFYAASPTLGMFSPGLWRVDAATGKVTTLIQAEAGGGNYNLADAAYLAPDGQLYFFFATAPLSPQEGAITRSPLQLFRSAPDGVTGRTLLSKEDFTLLNEALWAPDASFVIAVLAPAKDVYGGGQAKMIYVDGRPDVVLAPSAWDLRWGP